jgi:hypothetical protein
MSCQQKVGKNHNKITANKPDGNVAKVKYLGNTLKEFYVLLTCILKYAHNETKLMHYLSSLYLVTTPLHGSGGSNVYM